MKYRVFFAKFTRACTIKPPQIMQAEIREGSYYTGCLHLAGVLSTACMQLLPIPNSG